MSSQEGSSVGRMGRNSQTQHLTVCPTCSWDGRAGNIPVWAEDYNEIGLKVEKQAMLC